MLMPEQTAAVDGSEFLDAFLITCLPPSAAALRSWGTGVCRPVPSSGGTRLVFSPYFSKSVKF